MKLSRTPHITSKSRAIRRHPCLQTSALSANFCSCSLTLAGGPRSNKTRGGGRRSRISLIRVAPENITYKCSHQTSSSISVSAPVGGKRAQDEAVKVTTVSYQIREQSVELLACKRPLCLQTSAAALSRWPAGFVPTQRVAEVAGAAYRSSAFPSKT